MRDYKEYLDTKIGMILITEILEKNKRKYFRGKCECGNVKEIRVDSLLTGDTISCGCYRKICKIRKENSITDNIAYPCWSSMRQRCYNKNSENFSFYGGRGITVCDRWLDKENGFKNFLDDMGERPSKKYSIDRIDVNGNYCPENCRWATPNEQAGNRRNNNLLFYKGEQKCLWHWAREYNINPYTLWSRIFEHNMDMEEALNRPLMKNK